MAMGLEGSRKQKVKRYWNTAPRVSLHVNYDLWVLMMCQWKFINCNTFITLMGNIDNWGGYAYVGQSVYK